MTRRDSDTWDASIAGVVLTTTVRFCAVSGDPIELHARYGKVGNILQSLLDVWCESTSKGLKQGIPLSEYVRTFSARRFSPKGLTGDPLVPECTSLVDYIVRAAAQRCGGAL